MVVVHAHHERVERPARGGRGQGRRVRDLRVGQREAVPHGRRLGGALGAGEDDAGVAQTPGVEGAPRHQRRGARRPPRRLRAPPGAPQAVRDVDGAPVLLRGDAQHQLGGGEARRGERAHGGQLVQPAPGQPEVQAVEHGDDRPLGRRHSGVRRAGGQQLLDRLLVAPLVHQEPGVGDPAGADGGFPAALEPLAQVLPEARMRAHGERVVAPGEREVPAPQRREPLGGVRVPEAACALGRHLVEQGRLDQEVAVLRRHPREDAGRQVPVEGVGLAADEGQVGRRAPGLEDDPGDPSAGGGDRRRGVHVARTRQLQRPAGLADREGQLLLAQRPDAALEQRPAEVERELLAADQDDPRPRHGVAHEALDHAERLGRVGQALEVVEHHEDGLVAERLGQQAGRLLVVDAHAERARGDALGRRHAQGERRFEVGEQPSRRRLRGVDGEPRHGQPEPTDRLDDGRRLARARRGHDAHHREARHEVTQTLVDPGALDEPTAKRREGQLASDDRSPLHRGGRSRAYRMGAGTGTGARAHPTRWPPRTVPAT